VLLTWMYASGLAILVGGVINAQIEHANPLGKSPGEKQQPPDQVRFIPPPSANGSALQYP